MKICVTLAIATITLVAPTCLSGCKSKTASQKPQQVICTSDDIVKLTSDLKEFGEGDAISLSSFTQFIERDRHGEWTLDNGVGNFDYFVVEYLSTKWKDVRIWAKACPMTSDEKTKEYDGPISDMSIIISTDKSKMALINIMVNGKVRW